MEKKKRSSISVMIGGVHSFFPREMIRGMVKQATEEDINSYFFLRIHTKPFFRRMLGDISNNQYDYQFNTVHSYSKLSGTDGSIIGYGTIGFHMEQDNAAKFAALYNDRPVVIVTEKVDLPNCHSIISDNHHGMFLAVDHLIKQDHCKKVLFMRGPSSNTDAAERLQGYLDAMEQNGIPVFDSMIGQGDYSSYIDSEIERLLDANPDADGFAFSNDQMASSCYRVCEKRGLRVGIDLKIIGYDSGEFAENLTPRLTSVFQDAYGMGIQAVADMKKILQGYKLPNHRYPVSLSVKESCGCSPSTDSQQPESRDYAEELRQFRLEAAAREQQLLEYQGKSWFIPMLARDLNDCQESQTGYCTALMEKMKLLNVNAAYLFLLDHSLSYDGKSPWVCPDNLYLASQYRKGEIFTYQVYDRPKVTPENGIAQLTDDGDNHQFMVFLLFSGDRQYGLLACDVPIDELPFFYVVSLQLGLSLHYLEMSQVQEMHRRQLTKDIEAIRAKNMELDRLSGYDPLSGLMNLRGLTESIRQLCEDGIPRAAHVLYCDLDYLKQINDYFDHSEGNYAIVTCAEILKSCIRDTDIVARTGGDEFICLVLSDDRNFPEHFRDRLKNACCQANESSGKPYYIGLSVGIHSFLLDSPESFQAAMAEADHRLYEAKNHRRKDVRK